MTRRSPKDLRVTQQQGLPPTLKPREVRLLRFIERHVFEHEGVSPSYREIADGIGLATISRVDALLDALEFAGRIKRSGQRRGIEIVGLPTVLITITDEQLLSEVARRGLAAEP